MTTPRDPNPLSDKVLDLVLGQLPPGEASEVGAAAATDPALAAERARWGRCLAALDAAYDPGLDGKAGERIAARVVARVRDEEARAARTASVPRRVFWLRVLAGSVAVHALALGLVRWRSAPHEARPVEPFVGVAWGAHDDSTPAAAHDERPGFALPDVAPPSLAEAGLPVETLFAPEDGGMAPDVAPPSPSALASSLPTARAAFRVRTDGATKRWIEARVGVTGSLDAIQRSLVALAAAQRDDGSFPAPTGMDASEATALVVLPFLGDGSCSGFGPHRAVVARALAYVRGQRGADGAVRGGPHALWALAEDALLARSFLTPVEGRDRAAEIRALAARLAQDPAARASPALARALGVAADARVLGVGPSLAAVGAGDRADAPSWSVGDALLHARDAEGFRTWARRAHETVQAELASDALVRADVAAQDGRLVATARALLALQVPFRGN